jgi:phage shock protein C
MNLYRNPREGVIAGVCAGLADYWDVAIWVVRLLAVVAFLFTGTLAFWAYVAGWVLMAPRRSANQRFADEAYEAEVDFSDVDNVEMEYDDRRHRYREKKIFRYSDPGGDRLRRARERLDNALARVEDMESSVPILSISMYLFLRIVFARLLG